MFQRLRAFYGRRSELAAALLFFALALRAAAADGDVSAPQFRPFAPEGSLRANEMACSRFFERSSPWAGRWIRAQDVLDVPPHAPSLDRRAAVLYVTSVFRQDEQEAIFFAHAAGFGSVVAEIRKTAAPGDAKPPSRWQERFPDWHVLASDAHYTIVWRPPETSSPQ